MLFRGAGTQGSLQRKSSTSTLLCLALQEKPAKVENLMTLKQACSSEYQGAQDAFKDSMIH